MYNINRDGDKLMNEHYEINGFKVKKSNFYVNKGDRQVIHTSMRSDLYGKLKKIAKKHKMPISKCLDVIMLTFENHPEIMREFNNNVKKY